MEWNVDNDKNTSILVVQYHCNFGYFQPCKSWLWVVSAGCRRRPSKAAGLMAVPGLYPSRRKTIGKR